MPIIERKISVLFVNRQKNNKNLPSYPVLYSYSTEKAGFGALSVSLSGPFSSLSGTFFSTFPPSAKRRIILEKC